MASGSYVTPHSCEHCERIILTPPQHESDLRKRKQLLSKLSRSKPLDPGLIPIIRRMFLFELDYNQTYEGCAFFALLNLMLKDISRAVEGFLSWRQFAEQYNGDPPDSTSQVIGVTFENDGIRIGIVCTVLHVDETAEVGEWQLHPTMIPDRRGKQYIDWLTEVPFGVFAEEGDLAHDQFETLASTHLRSEAWFASMRPSFQECATSHPECAPKNEDFCPTRLIAITKDQGRTLVHLKEHCGPGIRYAALSYCWGGPQKVRTTKETVSQHLAEIRPDELPATLSDALEVTERMGLEYLWVDALCIIQDDDDDRGREIEAMGRIYECATLTIRASRAKAVSKGFLHDLKPYGHHRHEEGSVFRMKYRASLSGEINNLVLTLNVDFSSLRLSKDRLADRAWAFQEQHLSNRILDFGSTCVHYVCKAGYKCDREGGRCKPAPPQSAFDMAKDESLIMGDPKVLQAKFIDSIAVFFDEALSLASRRPGEPIAPGIDSLSPPHPQDAGKALTLNSWYKTVTTFSDKLLTFATDRLPAIAGIAERHGEFIKDQYLAGIWRSNIPYGLLWVINDVVDEFREHTPPNPSAPSWSWAASTFSISTHFYTGHTTFSRVKAELLDVELKYRTAEARYGAITSGYLTLRGPVRTADWKMPEEPGQWWEMLGTKADHGNDPEAEDGDDQWVDYNGDQEPSEPGTDDGENGHIFKPGMSAHDAPLSLDIYPDDTSPDVLVQGGPTVRVYLLVLVTDPDELSAVGLILHKNPEGRYKRLGVFDTLRGRVTRSWTVRDWTEVVSQGRNARTAEWLLQADIDDVTII